MSVLLRIVGFVALVQHARRVLSILRLVAVPTHLETLYVLTFGEPRHAQTATAWLLLGWALSVLFTILHFLVTTVELTTSANEHYHELLDEHQGPALVRIWIIVAVVIGHVAAICWVLSV